MVDIFTSTCSCECLGRWCDGAICSFFFFSCYKVVFSGTEGGEEEKWALNVRRLKRAVRRDSA